MNRIARAVLTILVAGSLLGQPRTALASTWAVYTTANSGLPHNKIHSAAWDRNGVMWFGTEGPAASFDGANWQTYTSVQNAHAVAVDGNNNIWLGTYGNGLWEFDGISWSVYTTANSGLPSDNIRSIAVDPTDGSLWFGTGDCCTYANGLAHLTTGGTWQAYTPYNSCLPNKTVLGIAIDSTGMKWLGTYQAGVVRFDGINCVSYASSNSPLPSDEVWSMAVDANDTPWIGTGAGLAHFDGLNWSVWTPANSPLPGGAVVVRIDPTGRIWFGSESLVMYDHQDFTVYTTSNSPLPQKDVWGLDVNANGTVLVGTGGGTAVFTPTAQVVRTAPYDDCLVTTSHTRSPQPGDANLLSQGYSNADGDCDAIVGTLTSYVATFGGTKNPFNPFQKNNPPSQQAEVDTGVIVLFTPNFTGDLRIDASLTVMGREGASAGSSLAADVNLANEIGEALIDLLTEKQLSKLIDIVGTLVKPTVAASGSSAFIRVSGASTAQASTALVGVLGSFPIPPNTQSHAFVNEPVTVSTTIPVTEGEAIEIWVGGESIAEAWGWSFSFANLSAPDNGFHVDSITLTPQ